MRVCYLLQTHRDPDQILRLVRTLRRGSPQSPIVVSHDFAAGPLDDRLLDAIPGVTLLRRDVLARRGMWSNLRPYLDAINWLLDRADAFDWLVALSGQDYPVRPLAEFESRLSSGSTDGLMTSWEALAQDGPWGRSRRGHRRYYFQYREPPAWSAPLWRWARRPVNNLQSLVHIYATYGVRVGVRARRTPFSASFRCYAGYHRHALSRAAVSYLRDALRASPALVAYYARTIAPDESLVQTVLVNSGRFRLSDEPLHYCDTEGRPDGSARILTQADLPAILRSGSYFARKFDPRVDRMVLDRLDERIGVGSGSNE